MNTWRARVRARGSLPSLTLGAQVVPGAELLDGVNCWVAAFRGAGLRPGDRLVTLLPTGAGLAQVVLAGLYEGLTLVPMPPATDLAAAARQADPAAAVVPPGADQLDWAWQPDGVGGPGRAPAYLRPAGPPTPLARLLCPPSTGGPWAALFDDNIEHAVDAVVAALQPEQGRWLSVLQWHQPAGLLLDLLPSFLAAASVARPDDEDLPSVPAVANMVERWQPTHTVAPFALVRRLWEYWGDLAPLRGLLGGLASGPGLGHDMVAELRETRLRTHRGAPELSCMVTLGEPGVWRLGALGRPVGCTVTEGPEGGLLISGRPVAGGQWREGALQLTDRQSPVVVALG